MIGTRPNVYEALLMTLAGTWQTGRLTRLLVTGLAVTSASSCVPEPPDLSHVCNRVNMRESFDRVKGDVGIWGDKIVRFSRTKVTWGPIIYVDIVPPPPSGSVNKIRYFRLWWETRNTPSAICRTGPDMSLQLAVNCGQSVPAMQLALTVGFEPEGTHNPEQRTGELVKYVTDHVLCELD